MMVRGKSNRLSQIRIGKGIYLLLRFGSRVLCAVIDPCADGKNNAIIHTVAVSG